MFPVTITVQNRLELNAVLAALDAEKAIAEPVGQTRSRADSAPAATQKDKADAKKPTKESQSVEQIHSPSKDKAQSSAPTQTALDSSVSSSTESSEAAESVEQPSYDNVKAVILKLSKEQGREAVEGVLSRFGVKRGPDIRQDSYVEFIAYANEVLAGARV